MKCLVINLDRSPARLAHLTTEFARVGVPFDRVAAMDGLKNPDLAGESPSLSLSEIGCFLSHRACWHTIAEGDDAYGAIFEDDVILADTAAVQLLTSENWIPPDADLVKVETVFRKAVIDMRHSRASRDYSLHRLHGMHLGSGGYVISKRAARDLVEATQTNDAPIDHVLFDQTNATSSSRVIYQLTPALCAQALFLSDKAAEFPSEIENTRTAQKQKRDLTKQKNKSPLAKLATEARRISWQIANVCRLRREKTIPFYYRGRRIVRP